eukprot:m.606541 g.606541  ORF g.606541 m.606541 type:complete len:77 (-) comp58112_c1_seq44:835-1065(-)
MLSGSACSRCRRDGPQFGEPTALESLLQEGIFDVNVQDKSGLTALMFAAIWNNMVCVQLLVNAGANPSICDQVRML